MHGHRIGGQIGGPFDPHSWLVQELHEKLWAKKSSRERVQIKSGLTSSFLQDTIPYFRDLGYWI
jgi:hypothetical protein